MFGVTEKVWICSDSRLHDNYTLFYSRQSVVNVISSQRSLARIFEQGTCTIYRRLLIGQGGHLGQSEAYDIS